MIQVEQIQNRDKINTGQRWNRQIIGLEYSQDRDGMDTELGCKRYRLTFGCNCIRIELGQIQNRVEIDTG